MTLAEKLNAWGIPGLTQEALDDFLWITVGHLWHLIGLHERGRCATLCTCPGRRRLESGGILFVPTDDGLPRWAFIAGKMVPLT